MAVLTRCEPEWRFYSGPLSPRLAIRVQINSIQPFKMLRNLSKSAFAPLDHFIVQVDKNYGRSGAEADVLGKCIHPGKLTAST